MLGEGSKEIRALLRSRRSSAACKPALVPGIFFSPRKPPKSYRRQLGEVLLKARPMAGAA